MQTRIFRKWWMYLLQGILLIVIAFIFFNNPVQVLAVISLWVGILTLATGVVGLVAHLVTKNDGGGSDSLWWSILTLLLGLLMVTKLGLTMKVITMIFGGWVLLTGILLLSAGWEHRKAGIAGWIMLLGGILSVLAGLVIMFNMFAGAVWISTVLGIQALVAGVGFIVLALIKRSLVNTIRHSFA